MVWVGRKGGALGSSWRSIVYDFAVRGGSRNSQRRALTSCGQKSGSNTLDSSLSTTVRRAHMVPYTFLEEYIRQPVTSTYWMNVPISSHTTGTSSNGSSLVFFSRAWFLLNRSDFLEWNTISLSPLLMLVCWLAKSMAPSSSFSDIEL